MYLNIQSTMDCCFSYLYVRLLKQVKQFLAVLGNVRLRGQQVQNFDVDVHGIGEHREELVILDVVQDLVVNVHQCVQFLRLQQVAEKSELLVGAARYLVLVFLQRIQQLGQRWKRREETRNVQRQE